MELPMNFPDAARSTVEAAVAVIVAEGRVLLTRRSRDAHLPGRWEFPGGKLEPGETPFECVVREVLEETGLHVEPLQVLEQSEFDYPDRRVSLHFISCIVRSGELCTRDGRSEVEADERYHQARWVKLCALPSLDMPEANRSVVRLILENARAQESPQESLPQSETG